jgi:outer membrane protein assembly factor BamB
MTGIATERRRQGPAVSWGGYIACVLLAVAGLPASAQDEQADRPPGSRAAAEEFDGTGSLFPQQLGLEARWAAVRARSNDFNLRLVVSLIEESAEAHGQVTVQEPVHAAIWTALDRFLRAQPASVLAALRTAQAGKASALAFAPDGDAESQDLFVQFRRLPWAEAAQAALLAQGELALRRGQTSVAQRSFEDVLAHASAASLLQRARVGLGLALANGADNPGALTAAFRDVPDETPLPWRGETRPASFIRQQLLAAGAAAMSSPASAPALADLSFRVLRPPAHRPWTLRGYGRFGDDFHPALPPPWGELKVRDGFMLLAGPNLLAGFDAGSERLLWSRRPLDTPQRRRERDASALPIPGCFQPALDHARIIARWGLDWTERYLTGLAAFDRVSGEMVWSTDNDPDWQEWWPASDPTLAEGRAYVLALRDGDTGISPLWLTCLDAATGRLRWKRLLGLNDAGLTRGRGAPPLPRSQVAFAHYGNAVTVGRGGVFVVSQLGFVARCDPRDGMVDWAAPYPRANLGTNLFTVLARRGAPPVLAGNAVIFLPRDAEGVFALEAESGAKLWERPVGPAQYCMGVHAGLLLLRDEQHVSALRTATGETAWEARFAEALLPEPQLEGAALYVGTRRALHRLDAASGKVLDKRPWEGPEPVRAFGVEGRTVWVLRDDSLERGPRQLTDLSAQSDLSDSSAKPHPPASSLPLPLALPLAKSWELPAPNPTLWPEPDGASEAGRILVHSEGVVRCLRTKPALAMEWQRFARPDLKQPIWSGDTVLLPGRASVLAVNAATGAARWEVTLPFEIVEAQACGPMLFVGRLRDKGMAAGIRIATGELAWEESLPLRISNDRREEGVRCVWDGRHLHLFAVNRRGDNDPLTVLLLDVAAGRVVETRTVPVKTRDRSLRAALGERHGFFIPRAGEAFEYALADGRTLAHTLPAAARSEDGVYEARLSEPWVLLRTRGQRRRENEREFHVRKLGDTNYAFEVVATGGAEILGHTLLVTAGDAVVIRAIDLLTKQETLLTAPSLPSVGNRGRVFGHRLVGDTLWTVSGFLRHDSGPNVLGRVDVFDLRRGAHLGTQPLRGLTQWDHGWGDDDDDDDPRMRVLRPALFTDTGLVFADRHGLHAFGRAARDGEGDRELRLARRAGAALTMDGKLDDWQGHVPHVIHDTGRPVGSVYLAHNDASLFVAVRYPDAFALPATGRLHSGAGDRLELGLKGARGNARFSLSRDRQGELTWQRMDGEWSRRCQAAMHHDPVRREMTYEVAVPLSSLTGHEAGWRQMEVAVAVWDDRLNAREPVRRLSWGAGLAASELVRSAYEAVYLDPLTPSGAGAAQVIFDAAPDLPEAAELLAEWVQVRRDVPETLTRFAREFLGRHPGSLAAERLLLQLDAAWRSRLGDATPDRVLALATEAGVPQTVRDRYRQVAGAALSQWIYLSRGELPRCLLLGLHDGSQPDGWANHLGYWVKSAGRWRTEPVFLGEADHWPREQWHELRVPLFLLSMHEQPIRGALFFQQGGSPVTWDRTAIVAGGRERLLMDDAPLRGRLEGQWEWVAQPVKSGAQAHRQAAPEARYDYSSHAVTDLPEPVLDHLVFPGDRPYLSQWVYLDPARPPVNLYLSLHHDAGHTAHAVWGDANGPGRSLGPLPPAGQWQELRLPLHWVGFDALPVETLMFGQTGGRVYWDHTTLLVQGKPHVLIEDDLPAGRVGRDRRPWLGWTTNRAGRTWAVPGRVGDALYCDGRTGYLEVPHAPELDPPELTVEAWVWLETYPLGGENRRWLVNKNFHESTEGHWGLLVRGPKAGFYLNVGGGDDGRNEGWSAEGSIQLRQWHHLALTYDGAVASFYLDGAPVVSQKVNKPRVPQNYPIHFGRRQDGYVYGEAALDEVRLYRRALSAEEVRASFHAPGSAAQEAQTAHWSFDGEALPADPAAGWQWVNSPAFRGQRARLQEADAAPANHGVTFREPVTVHLPFALSELSGVLKAQIPQFGPTPEALRFFDALARLTAGTPGERIGLQQWFVRSLPEHPRAPEVLGRMLQDFERAGELPAREQVSVFLTQAGLPARTRYQYARQYAYPYRGGIRAWQVLGPFADEDGQGFNTPLGPELEGVQLDRKYAGLFEEVAWRLFESRWDYIELGSVLGGIEKVVAYAVCWVHADSDGPAMLVTGVGERGKVWVNRALVLTAQNTTSGRVATSLTPIQLKAGWNEVLVKAARQTGPWGFELEVVDAEVTRAADPFKFSATPPARP